MMNPMNRVLAKRSDLHLLRKIWHMGVGSLCLLVYYQTGELQNLWAWAIFLVAVSGFLFDFLRGRYAKLNEYVLLLMGPFMRSSERHGMSGLPFYALGVSIALHLFQKEVAMLAIMFLVYSDPISSFFGIIYGKDKIMPNKSLQGAIAGFFTCYLISLFYGMFYHAQGQSLLWFSVLGGVVGAISEMMSAFNIDDNLTIPVISGLGLTILNYFFHVL